MLFSFQTCPRCGQSSLMPLIKLWGNEVAESAVKYVWPLLINLVGRKWISEHVCSPKIPSNSAGLKQKRKAKHNDEKKNNVSALLSMTSQGGLVENIVEMNVAFWTYHTWSQPRAIEFLKSWSKFWNCFHAWLGNCELGIGKYFLSTSVTCYWKQQISTVAHP